MPAPAQTLNVDDIISGYQGELFDDAGHLIAQVNTWHAQLAVANNDYLPAGQLLEKAIMKSYRVTLTFEETVVNDTQYLGPVINDLTGASGKPKQPVFQFQGQLFRTDGSESQYLFGDCVPDGNIDIANVTPGAIVARPWSWRCNKPPALSKLLGG